MDMSISIGRRGRVAALYSGCFGFDAGHTDAGSACVAAGAGADFFVCCLHIARWMQQRHNPKTAHLELLLRMSSNVNTTADNNGI